MSELETHHDAVSIAAHFQHARTASCFDYWLSLNKGQMPCYELWDPIQIHQSMPWCTIVERGGETGFRLRFAGTAICEFYGEEMTGQAIGYRMDEQTRQYYFANLEKLLALPCATLMTTQARSDSGRDCLFECLSLPISDKQGKGIRVINHQVIIEELPFGEAKTRFSMPDVSAWIDVGAGTPNP